MLNQAYSDIIFASQGKLYTSGDLLQVTTDDAQNPAIFFHPDFSAAFLLSFNEIGVMSVEPLSARSLRAWLPRCRDADATHLIRKCIAALEGVERRSQNPEHLSHAADTPDESSVLIEN